MSELDPTLAALIRATEEAGLEAVRRGIQPVPIRAGLKRPTIMQWPQITWDADTTLEQWQERLKGWGFADDEPYNLGVILGAPSGHLVDVDIDHPRARRFRDFLPRTMARSGRPGSPDSHFWYYATGTVPGFRQYKLADMETVTVEFRSTAALQTVIPPSDWVPKDWAEQGSPKHLVETREWSRGPWGGDQGPAVVDGRRLALQVALMGLATALLENWPVQGGRHEAYLGLAGGLLRGGDGIVHGFWERNASVVIRALATATQDDDGPDSREAESVDSTIRKIRDGKVNIWGFPKLGEIIGDDSLKAVRQYVAEIESIAGFASRNAPALPGATPASPGTSTPSAPASTPSDAQAPQDGAEAAEVADGSDSLPSWTPTDLEPFLTGQLNPVSPTVLVRDDGHALFYPGRLNMLFAPSESGKTLLALYTCIERMAAGERVVYLDFEDEPGNTIERLRSMGAADDDLRLSFTYIRPDEAIATMQRDHWGNHKATPDGQRNAEVFAQTLEEVDPTLIIADGMTSIYGLHGLDSNNSVETDVITTWLKSLARNGRTTVIIIDHMAKSADRGSMPIGSQHKVSMVQGSLLQVWPTKQPILGAIGELELIVLKDRPGQVRKHAGPANGKAQLAARVIIDSTTDKTIFTIQNPIVSTSNSPGAQVLSVNLATGPALRKLELQEARDALFLSAFNNDDTKSLSNAEVIAQIGATWKAMKWSNAALVTTRDRLIKLGSIDKSGGDRGPKVRYTLTSTVDDPIADTAATPTTTNSL